MTTQQRELAEAIIKDIKEAECYADRKVAYQWLSEQGFKLLVAALAEIDRLKAQAPA